MAQPTHRLVIQEKNNKNSQTLAGVAWQNEKGWFSIRLNPGISLSYRDREDFFISLYPMTEGGGPSKYESQEQDDVPF